MGIEEDEEQTRPRRRSQLGRLGLVLEAAWNDDACNAGLTGLVMTVPLTSKVAKSKNIPAHTSE
jgi:hypothetical protein